MKNDKKIHLSHCYQGEYSTTCKYGNSNCPAKVKKESLTIIIRDKLKETFEWFVPPNHIPSNKKLYYEALRIQKSIHKGTKNRSKCGKANNIV